MCAQTNSGSFYTIMVKPDPKEKYFSAEFYLWVPDGVSGPLRGIIMKQHGCSDHGNNHVFDLQFQQFSRKWSMALMSSHFTYHPTLTTAKCADWYNPEKGTGRAFFAALQYFAEASVRTEITNLPIAFYGHSGGGGWSAFMNKLYPERTIGYVHIKGKSIGEVGTISGKALANPGLLIIGEHDLEDRNDAIHDYLERNRKKGALLTKIVAKNTQHEVGNVRYLAIQYLDEIFIKRLPDTTCSNGVTILNEMNLLTSWLGNNDSFAIDSIHSYADDQSQASWLPSQAFAESWRNFASNRQLEKITGGVTNLLKPQDPNHLHMKEKSADSITIAWSAQISWQAGLKMFKIYRNDAYIGCISGQSLQYGDYPDDETKTVPFEFRDSDLIEGLTYRYQVTQVDYADQESIKSDSLIYKKY